VHSDFGEEISLSYHLEAWKEGRKRMLKWTFWKHYQDVKWIGLAQDYIQWQSVFNLWVLPSWGWLVH